MSMEQLDVFISYHHT